MIATYVNKELFERDSIDKQLKIEIVGKTDVITNEHIKSEAFTLEESLCSDLTLRFGACESSTVTFEMANNAVAYSLKGKTIKISETLNGDEDNPFNIGTYIITSDKKSSDGLIRTVSGYDAMKGLLERDVSEWYNTYFPNSTTTHTLKQIRENFLTYMGIEIAEGMELANENVSIGKTITPTELTGATVINAICEMSGVFGHIDRDNKFKFIDVISQGDALYPSDTLFPNDLLYPTDGANRLLSFLSSAGGYITGQFEDFKVEEITGITIKTKEGGIGCSVGTDDNVYIIQNNFLLFNKTLAELTTIANNILGKVGGVNYMPYEIECKGNPCYEVGDGIVAETRNGIIKSYILHRTLKGVQSLHDTYRADGDDNVKNKTRSIGDLFDEVSQKTNTLERDLSQTQSTITDTARGLQSQITQNAGSISMKVGYGEVISSINQTSESIKISASKINLSGYVTVSSLKGNGTTEINGSNITTGTISADRLAAGTISVDKLKPNSGSNFSFSNLEASNTFTIDRAAFVANLLEDGTSNYVSNRVRWTKFSNINDSTYVLTAAQSW